ncbi:uncharacterized protein LOC143913642 [Arctopsyche grandis]|uniref:uncharacterized protein LOC143913642 n=1 Tax=Arctopsyche grandis TaxID=121162 RepID=UPI00406D8AB2
MFFTKYTLFAALVFIVNARPDVSELKQTNSLLAIGPGFNSESSKPVESQSVPALGPSVNFQVPPSNENLNAIANIIDSAPRGAVPVDTLPIQLDPDIFGRVQYALEKIDSSKLYFPTPLIAVRALELPVPDEAEYLRLSQSSKASASVASKPKYLPPPADDGYNY